MFFDENYFYSESIGDTEFPLPEEESRHLSKALRLKPGDRIWVTDGHGTIAECEIIKTDPRKTIVAALRRQRAEEGKPRFTLAVGLLKKNGFETLVELVSQLPVSRILPMVTEHAALPAEAYGAFLARLNQKARAALTQSKRAFVTEIALPVFFDDALAQAAESGYACLFEKGALPHDAIDRPRLASALSVFVMVGPEGGFSEKEITRARQQGLSILELGNTRLRAEAAGFAAVVTLLTVRGTLA